MGSFSETIGEFRVYKRRFVFYNLFSNVHIVQIERDRFTKGLVFNDFSSDTPLSFLFIYNNRNKKKSERDFHFNVQCI